METGGAGVGSRAGSEVAAVRLDRGCVQRLLVPWKRGDLGCLDSHM